MFCPGPQELQTVYKHWDASWRLSKAQASVQVPEVELPPLPEANKVAKSSRGAVTRLGGELTDVQEKSKRHSATLRISGDADWNTLHAAARECTGLHLSFDAEWQKLQSFKRTIRSGQRCVINHLTLGQKLRGDLQSLTRGGPESCLQFMWYQVARKLRDYGALYQTHVDMHLEV